VKLAIILNGISRRKKFFYKTLLPAIQTLAEVDVYETQSPTDAINFSAEVVEKNYDAVSAAGGDGTLHQVLNGMLRSEKAAHELPALSVIPLGSGNDLARALGINATPQSVKNFLQKKPTLLDVGHIEYRSDGIKKAVYFMNVADAGMGPEVVSKLQASSKPFGAGLAYYTAILSTFFTYRPMVVNINTPAGQWSDKLRTLAVGNGKFYGHGLCIAPDASLQDGTLNTFVCGNVSVFDFMRYSTTLKNSDYVRHSKVHYAMATTVELTAETPCRIEADGELLGFLPATINVVPNRIRFLV
jgi:diacylglycerol kinase (ATP)